MNSGQKFHIPPRITSLYNFSITKDNANTENETFTIELANLDFSITEYPTLYVNLNPSSEILNNFTAKLTTYNLSIMMGYYYFMDSSTKNNINITKNITNSLNYAISSTYMANNIFSYSSSAIFLGMISMDAIRFLRYFEINYPENVKVIFNTVLPTATTVPDIQIEENKEDGTLPEIFLRDDVSIYLVNNIGNLFIGVIIFWAFGLFIAFFVNVFKNSKSKVMHFFMIVGSLVFVWNYALSYFLSNYMSYALFTFLSFRFPPYKTSIGYYSWMYRFWDFIICILKNKKN